MLDGLLTELFAPTFAVETSDGICAETANFIGRDVPGRESGRGAYNEDVSPPTFKWLLPRDGP